MNTKTFSPTAKQITRNWHLIDIDGQVLGRSATQICAWLQGKYKTYFTSHLDCGDYVVVVNAAKVKITGNKSTQKTYFRHSGYPGGAKTITFDKLLAKDPSKIISDAVAGMLPKNKLRDPRLRRLKIFSGPEHKYQDKFKHESGIRNQESGKEKPSPHNS